MSWSTCDGGTKRFKCVIASTKFSTKSVGGSEGWPREAGKGALAWLGRGLQRQHWANPGLGQLT